MDHITLSYRKGNCVDRDYVTYDSWACPHSNQVIVGLQTEFTFHFQGSEMQLLTERHCVSLRDCIYSTHHVACFSFLFCSTDAGVDRTGAITDSTAS